MLGPIVKLISNTLKWFSKGCLALYMLPWEFAEGFSEHGKVMKQSLPPTVFSFFNYPPCPNSHLACLIFCHHQCICLLSGAEWDQHCDTRSCLVFSPLWCLPLLCWHKHFSATPWTRPGNWSFWKFNLTKKWGSVLQQVNSPVRFPEHACSKTRMRVSTGAVMKVWLLQVVSFALEAFLGCS